MHCPTQEIELLSVIKGRVRADHRLFADYKIRQKPSELFSFIIIIRLLYRDSREDVLATDMDQIGEICQCLEEHHD